MASKRVDYRPHMSKDEQNAHDRRQADERVRRGLVGFTRTQRREDVEGRTAGENRVQTTARKNQPRKKR